MSKGFLYCVYYCCIEDHSDRIVVAEGNTFNDNISRVIERPIDEHIRSYIRIPDGYRYERRIG